MLFDYAQYHFYDAKGNHILLKVHYRENSFEIEKDGNVQNAFREEVSQFARDLLARKHGVNFAEA